MPFYLKKCILYCIRPFIKRKIVKVLYNVERYQSPCPSFVYCIYKLLQCLWPVKICLENVPFKLLQANRQAWELKHKSARVDLSSQANSCCYLYNLQITGVYVRFCLLKYIVSFLWFIYSCSKCNLSFIPAACSNILNTLLFVRCWFLTYLALCSRQPFFVS